MKIYEMAALLNDVMDTGAVDADAEIFVEVDGLLHDFKVEDTPETFDGFDTVTPAGYKLILID